MTYEPGRMKNDFEDDGFLVVTGLLSEADLSTLRDRMDSLIRDVDALPPHLREKIFLERQHVINNPQWYEGVITPAECGDAVRQIEDLAEFDAAFADLQKSPALSSAVDSLFAGREPRFHSMIGRPKAARVGNGISNGNFHRDTPFEPYEAALAVIAVLCLDDMSAGNGGTAFIRGSHRVSREEAKRPYWREVPPEQLDLKDRVAIRCPAGSGVFFNTRILHSAGHNRSDQPRRTILCEWFSPLPR